MSDEDKIYVVKTWNEPSL